jgi:DNA-3-methyladenine glycosylase
MPKGSSNSRRKPGSGRKLGRSFYNRDAASLAQSLLGKILVRRLAGSEYRARIVETEGYVGPEDLACHSSRGRTARTEVMFGPPGCAYVYLIYGMYDMFNIVAGPRGSGQAVLIRAAEPIAPSGVDLSGPGRLARGLRITRADNALDLTGDSLFLLDNSNHQPRIGRARRVGVDYAKEWKDALLRFYDLDSRAVSRPRPVEHK